MSETTIPQVPAYDPARIVAPAQGKRGQTPALTEGAIREHARRFLAAQEPGPQWPAAQQQMARDAITRLRAKAARGTGVGEDGFEGGNRLSADYPRAHAREIITLWQEELVRLLTGAE